MKNVGLRLKEQREEVGFTLEEMSAKTKITIPQLRALEEGNLDFFKEDISYVPYFVRFYAQALYLDYETLRIDVDTAIKDLHHTQKLKIVAQNKTTKENIENRIKDRSKMNRNTTALRPAGKRKVDYSLLSMLVFIILLLITLIVIFFVYIYPMIIDSKANNNETDIIALPQNPNEEVEEKPEEDDPTIPFVSAVEVTALNSREYEITGYVVDEEVLITVTFVRDVWMKVYIDGVATDNPKSKIYKKDEVMEIRLLAKDDTDVMLHFGNLKGNLVKVNNEEIVWDTSIANWLRGIKINFRFKGV
ncbi:MAG: helix-turn-helix transcriptional regulator [Erysipelotrichaceae bacterium]|nr:helix-turn-helix transcriptional regulator [Erysipelotrichaceae bacterium]